MSSIFFVGGTRSGKSRLAENWVQLTGLELQKTSSNTQNANHPKLLYIATALAEDDETKTRINTHQRRRGKHWQCLEAPLFKPQQIENLQIDALLLDCLSMWLNNHLAKDMSDAQILTATKELAEWINCISKPIAIVSSELGQGIVPMSALARRYRDLHGLINQHIARACQNVLLISCGLPLAIKGKIPQNLLNNLNMGDI